MQQTLIYQPSGSADLEVHPALNVVIAYEDFEAGKHAKKTYDYLVENLGQEFQLTSEMWKFDVLSIPKLREIAVKDALQADIILLSIHSGELPTHVTAWIESWLGEPGNAMALVALFAGGRDDTVQARSLRSYLAGVAKRAKMEFFAQPDDRPESEHPQPRAAAKRAWDPDERTLSALASIVQRDIAAPRWGFGD